MDHADGEPVVEAAVAVRPGPGEREPEAVQRGAVAIEQLRQRGAVFDTDAVLMLRKTARIHRVEAAVMEKGDRTALDEATVERAIQRTRVQVPVGNVVAQVAQNPGAGEQAWNQINPLLVDEQAMRHINRA